MVTAPGSLVPRHATGDDITFGLRDIVIGRFNDSINATGWFVHHSREAVPNGSCRTVHRIVAVHDDA